MTPRAARKRTKPAAGEVVWKPRTQWTRSPRLAALGKPSSFADDADRARDVLGWHDLETITRHALLGAAIPAGWGPLAAGRWRAVAWLALRGELSRDATAMEIARRGCWSSLERERAGMPLHPVEPSEAVKSFLEVQTRAVALRLGEASGEVLPAAPRVRVGASAELHGAEIEVGLPDPEDALLHAAGLIEAENLTGGPLVVRGGVFGSDVELRSGALVVLRWAQGAAGEWRVLAEHRDGDFIDARNYEIGVRP